jgi:hypothetical protein
MCGKKENTMSKTLNEIAKLVAEWWADKISNPHFDIGDESIQGSMAMVLASRLVEPVLNQNKEKFISYLENMIEEILKKGPDCWIFLDVDYGPCRRLKEAADFADIGCHNFPWKTYMSISRNCIKAKSVYGTPYEFLYANKAYWIHEIDACKRTIKEYEDDTMSGIEDAAERKTETLEFIKNIEEKIKEYQANCLSAED